MQSKIERAKRVLKEDGPGALARKTAQYITSGHGPTERHIQYFQQKEELVIAEIGVWKGHHAERLIKDLDVKQLYLIDPYYAYDAYDEPKSNQSKMKSAREEAHDRLGEYPNVTWIEKFSDEAVQDIEEELDFVYIDGNHEFEYVLSDMETYYPLVKEGGIVAGDDMDWKGVARAFVKFSVKNDLQPHLEPYHPDWYFIKGEGWSHGQP